MLQPSESVPLRARRSLRCRRALQLLVHSALRSLAVRLFVLEVRLLKQAALVARVLTELVLVKLLATLPGYPEVCSPAQCTRSATWWKAPALVASVGAQTHKG